MLFKYEMNKILKRRLNLIAMLMGYIVLGITTIYPVLKESEYILETETDYEGMEAIRFNQDRAASQTDYLTNDYVAKVIQEIQGSGLTPDTDIGYLSLNDRYGSLYNYLMNCYKPIGDTEFKPNILMEIDRKDRERFYKARIEKIDTYLNSDFSYGNYTDTEKAYWLSKAKNVKTPFKWGDIFVPKHYDTVIAMVFYLLFVLAICIAPVFSSEHEQGTAGILLASKLGQSKLVSAKVLAAYAFSFLYVGIGFLIACVGLFIALGTDGFELPVQLMDDAICYQMNMGQFILLQLLVAVVAIFFTVTLTMMISAITKSTFGTMIVMLVVMIGPAFIPFSKTNGLFNHITALAISRMVDLKVVLKSFIDYRVGGMIVDLLTFTLVFHVLCGVVLLLLMRKAFVKRAIHS